MEQLPKASLMLEMIECPAFCVRDGVIIQENQAARQMLITTGMHVKEILVNDLRAYEAYRDGLLSLTLQIREFSYQASVVRTEEYDIFQVDVPMASSELKILSLMAQQIRSPLSTAMMISDEIEQLCGDISEEKMGQLHKSLFRINRMIGNISDIVRYSNTAATQMVLLNFTSFFAEMVEKIAALLEPTNTRIEYNGLTGDLFGLADPDKLYRAMYNLVSNAAKYSPEGCTVKISLHQHDDQLCITVEDNGVGIPSEKLSVISKKHFRPTGIEDGRNGIGLGLQLVRSVAQAHGGTILIRAGTGNGASVVFTIRIVEGNGDTLRSALVQLGGYTGGRDSAMMELSDILPAESYLNK